ncbi:MAG: hypothetical protein JKP92_01485 [Alphaproteobacteria bacterium]|jgi:hypothetical protein|nr:hypothetical protein [Alphaproteobacteria bacterium]
MTAPAPVLEVIRAATGQGVALSVTPDARLHAEGPKEALERHLPTLRARKPEIIAALKARHAHGAGPTSWPHRYAGHVAAIVGDRAVAFVSGEVLVATAHIRTAWDWLADNDPPVGTYTEEECQERLSRARAALTAHGVPPAIPLEALDRHHCARLRAEGALIALDALAERVAVMREAPEYPTLDAAFAAALEDVRGRYTHDKT